MRSKSHTGERNEQDQYFENHSAILRKCVPSELTVTRIMHAIATTATPARTASPNGSRCAHEEGYVGDQALAPWKSMMHNNDGARAFPWIASAMPLIFSVGGDWGGGTLKGRCQAPMRMMTNFPPKKQQQLMTDTPLVTRASGSGSASASQRRLALSGQMRRKVPCTHTPNVHTRSMVCTTPTLDGAEMQRPATTVRT